MSDALLAKAAVTLAKNLPFPALVSFAEAIRCCEFPQGSAKQTQIVASLSHPAYRAMASEFLALWQEQSSDTSSATVALAVLTAAYSEQDTRSQQSVELVWTGPEVGVIPLRKTEQALLQLIDSAQERILIVSYAVYHIPRIGEALLKAAQRNVSINIIIETPDRLEGENAYSTLRALGTEVTSRCQLFYWPLEKRELDAKGKPGILHVKCAVADGEWLFLSSANLTEYAFTLNLELGILLRGVLFPSQVESHFHRMIEQGVFIPLRDASRHGNTATRLSEQKKYEV